MDIESIKLGILSNFAYDCIKKTGAVTLKAIKNKFGNVLKEEKYIEMVDEINEISKDKKEDLLSLEKALKENEKIMEIINSQKNGKVIFNNSNNNGIGNINNRGTNNTFIGTQNTYETKIEDIKKF